MLTFDYDAIDVRIKLIEEKMRCHFRVKNKKSAVKLYTDVASQPFIFNDYAKAAIFP